MKILLQIALVFGLCLLGEGIAAVLPIPFPGSVIAMILLFLCLLCGAVKPHHLKEKADFLLQNMAFFFIPAGVGLIQYLDVFKKNLWQLLLICVITTLLTFSATAYTVQVVILLQKKIKEKKEGQRDE